MRTTQIPKDLDQELQIRWNKLSDKEKDHVASAVQKLSTFFQEGGGPLTPWQDTEFLNAYLFYFLPLNLARGSIILSEMKWNTLAPPQNVVDMGSGLGNFLFLKSQHPQLENSKVHLVERSREARILGQKLSESVFGSFQGQNLTDYQKVAKTGSAWAFFSYSWIEMKLGAEQLKDFELLIFIEPSIQTHARSLMALRQDFIDLGFTPLAPCTHTLKCPLLIHSQRDWCHDRIHFQKSPWFEDLESRLPMKNSTLTFSYLIVSKSNTWPQKDLARVIGDTLREKGKTRQAVCFDDQRRFLSWLKKEHPAPPQLDHGALIQIDVPKIVGNEVRSSKIMPT